MFEKTPAELLRAWATAYRDGPKELRFPSDPEAEFFPVDMERAAKALDDADVKLAATKKLAIDAINLIKF